MFTKTDLQKVLCVPWVRYVVQQVKPALEAPAAHDGGLAGSEQPTQIRLSANTAGITAKVRLAGALPSVWDIWMEFQASGFSLSRRAVSGQMEVCDGVHVCITLSFR